MNRVVLVLCAALAGACRSHASAEAAASPAAATPPAREHVRLTSAQLAKIRIEELSTRSPGDTIPATGTVEFDADHMVKLLAPVAGQVRRLAVNVGDAVRTNAVLFVLSSRDVAAAVADHEASEKDLELAQRTQAMTQDLYEHQAASRIALQQADNELAKARTRQQQTEESLRVLGLEPGNTDGHVDRSSTVPVRAPIAGTVIERTVTDGQFVGTDATPLVTIADLSRVWVQADVFERDLPHIAINQTGDVTTAAYPSERFVAHVSRIASVVDPQTRTAKVRFVVANAGKRLKPGMFASIDLHMPDSVGVLTVPTKAVFVENGQTFVYVQFQPQEFIRRSIETAPTSADRLRVVQGLAAGDCVITDGVLLLRQLEADAVQ